MGTRKAVFSFKLGVILRWDKYIHQGILYFFPLHVPVYNLFLIYIHTLILLNITCRVLFLVTGLRMVHLPSFLATTSKVGIGRLLDEDPDKKWWRLLFILAHMWVFQSYHFFSPLVISSPSCDITRKKFPSRAHL